MTHDADIERLFAYFDSTDLTYLRVTIGEFDITLSRTSPPSGEGEPEARSVRAPAPAAADVPKPSVARRVAQPPPAAAGDQRIATVTAPSIGILYVAPTPDAPPFVEVGSRVEADTTVALLEAMKLFTAVQAGVSGTVVEILAQNKDLIEFGQPLLRVSLD